VLGLAVAGAFLWPKTYASDAKLFIRVGRSSVSLDPTVAVDQVVAASEPREREINSIMEILRSRELMEAVVDEVGAVEILRAKSWLPSFRPTVSSESVPTPGGSQILQEKAVRELEQSIASHVTKDSNVINLSCRAPDPRLAQEILRVYVRSFTDHHLRLNRTTGSYEFLVDQVEQLRTRLEQAKLDLRDAKNRVGIGSVEGQTNLIEKQVMKLQEDLTTTRTTLAATEAKLSSLREQYPDIEGVANDESSGGASATAVDNMRADLYRLQIHKRELLAKLSPHHPRVLAVLEQESQARQLLAQQEYLTETTQALTLTARVAELDQSLEEARQRLLRLNEDEIRIHELDQRVKALEANYNRYVENRERARIDGELETERISNVNVAQSPSLVSKPVSPDKALVLVLGMFGALFSAMSITLASEYFDDSFQAPEQVERVLKLPVVMTVPEARRHALIWR